MLDFSKVKLIIWDLDDTIWRGTLSEDGFNGIKLNDQIKYLFARTTDCGVINSVCSKNTQEETIPVLENFGLNEYIVFPSIDWTPKGARIKEMIRAMALRPANVLFIDDNIQNLNEAKFYSEGLLTAEPNIIPALKEYFDNVVPKDLEHKRLKQYRVLEDKHEAASKFSSNEEFLYSSNIRVEVHTDCLEQLDRLFELSQRSNQLNFTKNREGIEDFKHSIETADKAGYITVKDNFGDYGIVGFFVLKDNVLKHFLFSCRTIGQGIEQYVYAILGYPELEIIGEVYNKVSKDSPFPSWINQENFKEKFSNIDQKKITSRILLQGACDLGSTIGYLNGDVASNLSYSGKSGNLVESHLHHEGILNQLLPEVTKRELAKELPFTDDLTFDGDFWSDSYDLIVLSTLAETNLAVYERKIDGVRIAFAEAAYPMTDKVWHSKLISGEVFNASTKLTQSFLDKFSREWSFLGKTTPEGYINFLNSFFSRLKHTNLALILGSEIPYAGNNCLNYRNREQEHKILNAAIRKYAEKQPRLHLIELTELITSQSDFTNNINHFVPRLYFQLAQKIVDVASICSDSNLQRKSELALMKRRLKIWIHKYFLDYAMPYNSLQYRVLRYLLSFVEK